ncbi:peptidoglycan editing factor PgeF [Hydrogenophaga sp.]|uniref:peptidoglycan editing factor PgeF n=1 Tax=Hydrogenophaga sp. TaxID=1904254 RepID=UPI0027303FE3|nr:peptidoglycan editing factor PgeF [Hydrogenophaga sp.]MDP2017097.1 peptidoglycan editing factor PgeF [Hydrogenophaga sp.]MDP3165536.1 peptidoglycan editing factor PgeF [Hydrogenophaga sp.]MDP3810511.1 peptidoglycan editing factor PgeF [Hydrogenophaga sp.]
MLLTADGIQPDWPAPPGVRALFTTRVGGVSVAPFDSFNLGDHVRDEPLAVAGNRERLAALISPARPVFLQQVHGTQIVRLAPHTPDGTVADACVAHVPDVAATIMVADCLPVLFAHASGTAVAAAHAGWRGLVHGVLEATARALSDAAGEGELMAWLGPCIGPQAFEVGTEVCEAFVAVDHETAAHFWPLGKGKFLADLPALARRRLQKAGITNVHGNDGSPAWCTVTQTSRFFSHRRDAVRLGSTGRMAACIWID